MTATHLTLVTTCKGRLHHLRRSLPTFLGQVFPAEEGDVAYRVVVVDYGCPDGAYDWCREHVDDPRLEVVRVEDGVEWFNLSRARNIGARVALAGSGETGLLAFIDVDLELPPDSLARGLAAIREEGILRLNHSRRRHDDGRPCFNGQVILAGRAFRELRGYDEAMSHWGGDDIDLYNRSKRLGHASGTWDSGLKVIHHEEEDRLRFIPVGDREESLEHNHRVVRDRGGDHVNPDGYGISSDYRLLRGEGIGLEHPPADEPRGCVCDAPGWCERHQCAKTPHWHVLCRTREAYFQLWEEGRGPGQGRAGEEPGLVGKAVNLGRAVARHVADGGKRVPHEVLLERLEICKVCPSCDTERMVCREKSCGCKVANKARWRSERCPQGRWEAVAELESETGDG